MQVAESEREGGISPRVSPMTDVRDVGSLLSRAGFTLTTVDTDDITVNFPCMFELMQDLRFMGESNAVLTRRPFLKSDTMIAASAIYKGNVNFFLNFILVKKIIFYFYFYSEELHGNPDGSIPATFQVIIS